MFNVMRKIVKSRSRVEYDLVPERLGKDVKFTDTELRQVEHVDKSNRLSKVMEMVEFNVYDKFTQYKVSDFYMENLIACGAVDSLKAGQYYDTDIDKVLGQLDPVEVNDK